MEDQFNALHLINWDKISLTCLTYNLKMSKIKNKKFGRLLGDSLPDLLEL